MRRPRLRFKVRSMMVAVAIAGVVVAFTKYLCIDNRPADLLAAAIGVWMGSIRSMPTVIASPSSARFASG